MLNYVYFAPSFICYTASFFSLEKQINFHTPCTTFQQTTTFHHHTIHIPIYPNSQDQPSQTKTSSSDIKPPQHPIFLFLSHIQTLQQPHASSLLRRARPITPSHFVAQSRDFPSRFTAAAAATIAVAVRASAGRDAYQSAFVGRASVLGVDRRSVVVVIVFVFFVHVSLLLQLYYKGEEELVCLVIVSGAVCFCQMREGVLWGVLNQVWWKGLRDVDGFCRWVFFVANEKQ